MIFNSVADIYAANDDVRGRLVARVEGLDEAQQSFRPADDAWSAAEIVEHLALIEGRITNLFNVMLKKIESAAEPGAQPRPMQPFSLDEFAAQARQQFNAPDEVCPRGGNLADALAQLRASRAALSALQPRFEAVDGASATYPHPAFGPLNLYQWLAFIGAHEARHLAQLERGLAQTPATS
jgi:hypothetical protein